MADEPSLEIANMEGGAALPRSNGELVFEAPWEGRAFGIAVSLNERGLYPWRAFRDGLVDEIAHDDGDGAPTSYYQRWLATLEGLLVQQGVVTPQELAQRAAEYASGERSDDWVAHDPH